MTRAAVYTRISQARDEDAPGIDRQLEAARQMCAARGWEVVEVFREADVSAFRQDVPRPEFDRMHAMVLRGEVDVVVAWKLDRLFRRLREAVNRADEWREGLQKPGSHQRALTCSAGGRLRVLRRRPGITSTGALAS